MAAGGFIGVDWGTTNRRVFCIDAAGAVTRTERDGCGILSVPQGGFDAEVAGLRARFGDAPMLLAGMVGSNRGWVDAGYVDCPATVRDLAAAMANPAEGVWIVPGVKRVHGTRGDVMRGEEVQLFGAEIGRAHV